MGKIAIHGFGRIGRTRSNIMSRPSRAGPTHLMCEPIWGIVSAFSGNRRKRSSNIRSRKGKTQCTRTVSSIRSASTPTYLMTRSARDRRRVISSRGSRKVRRRKWRDNGFAEQKAA